MFNFLTAVQREILVFPKVCQKLISLAETTLTFQLILITFIQFSKILRYYTLLSVTIPWTSELYTHQNKFLYDMHFRPYPFLWNQMGVILAQLGQGLTFNINAGSKNESMVPFLDSQYILTY